MSLTTNPKDPDLKWGPCPEEERVPQNKKYLILSEEERKKGFIRPVRRSYIHIGQKPKYPLRDLTEEEKTRYASYNYVKFENYPRKDESCVTGKFWTQKELDR